MGVSQIPPAPRASQHGRVTASFGGRGRGVYHPYVWRMLWLYPHVSSHMSCVCYGVCFQMRVSQNDVNPASSQVVDSRFLVKGRSILRAPRS